MVTRIVQIVAFFLFHLLLCCMFVVAWRKLSIFQTTYILNSTTITIRLQKESPHPPKAWSWVVGTWVWCCCEIFNNFFMWQLYVDCFEWNDKDEDVFMLYESCEGKSYFIISHALLLTTYIIVNVGICAVIKQRSLVNLLSFLRSI